MIDKKRQIHPNRERSEHKHYLINRGRKGIFHYENFSFLDKLTHVVFRMLGLWERGVRNTERIVVTETDIQCKNLPKALDGYKVLFISDLHLDHTDTLIDSLLQSVDSISYDICVFGGDYCNGGPDAVEVISKKMARLAETLKAKARLIGVLGNHDSFSLVEKLEQVGIEMLINESLTIDIGEESLNIIGVDDCHYHRSHEIAQATEGCSRKSFSIFLSHSPELFKSAAESGADLYLAGHTHGGQICLPGGVPIVTNASVPRRMVSGHWEYNSMQGYTSRGVGSASTPIRFFCSPEIALLTLRK